MYSAQHTMMAYITAMKRKYAVSHVLRGEDNAPFRNDQKTSFIRTWSNFLSGNYLSSMWPANNPLSVTIVNNEILNSDLSEYSSTTNKELSYILQEKKLLDLKQGNPEKYMKDMVDVSILEQASKNHLQDWPCNNVDDPTLIKNRNYVNLIKNSGDTYEDNSTMESHSMLHVNETEKTTEDNITDVFGPSDVDSQKREIGIHEDMDVESFLVVSHSDVPAIHAGFVRENPMSRLSNVWRNTWNNLTSRVYCKTESADPGMSVKRPSCSTKQHRRRKANAIAIGRGRGRARCQLRRSGVSQTVCRKEYTQYDGYEVCPNDLVDSAPNDCPLDSKLGNLNNIDVPDATQFIKQTNSPAISTSPKTTAKGKSKARKKKKTKAKYMTKVRYIADPSRSDSDYYEDSNSEMHNARKSSFRSRLLSDSSMDSEDCFIVFESNDDELPETCEKQGVTEHPTKARNVPDSSMRTNDSPYKDSDNETCEEKDSFRLRSLSESSTDSTDNFIVFDEQEATECPRMRYDYLTKINDKRREDCNSQTQKNSFQRHRLLSNSSENTDDSFSIVFTDIEENCAIDDVDGDEIEEMSFYEGDSRPEDESISEDGQDNEELIAQSKKVSFDLTPVVHIMVKWNYAYRAARKGNWEEIARDNERFRGRINSIAIVLDPILKSNHRSQVWQKRFAFPEQFWPD